MWSKFVDDERDKIADDPKSSFKLPNNRAVRLPADRWEIKSGRTRKSYMRVFDIPPESLDHPASFDCNQSIEEGSRQTGNSPEKQQRLKANRKMLEEGPEHAEPLMLRQWQACEMFNYGSLPQHGDERAGRNRIRIDDLSSDENAVYVDHDKYFSAILQAIRRQKLDGGFVHRLVRDLVNLLFPPVMIHFYRANASTVKSNQRLMKPKVVNAIEYVILAVLEHHNCLRVISGSKVTIEVAERAIQKMINTYTQAKQVLFQQSRFASTYEDKYTFGFERKKNMNDIELKKLNSEHLGLALFRQWELGEKAGFKTCVLTAKTFNAKGELTSKHWYDKLLPVLKFRNISHLEKNNITAVAAEEFSIPQQTQPSSSSSSSCNNNDSNVKLTLQQQKLLTAAFNMGDSGMDDDDFHNWLAKRRKEYPTWFITFLQTEYAEAAAGTQ